MSAATGDIRFGEVLSRLLATSRYRGARASLAEDLLVSQSAISQYLSGAALPRLDVLARLAELLNVSADYLIFGTDRHLPLTREQAFLQGRVGDFLEGYRANLEREAWLRLELATRLENRLEDLLKEELPGALETLGVGPGLLRDDEVRQVEALSRSVAVISTTLKYNVAAEAGGGFRPGPFADIVVENILDGAHYTFVVPATPELRDAAAAMSLLFRGLAGRDISDSMEIWLTPRDLVGGFLIYDFDVERLRARRPYLYRKVEPFAPQGRLGLMAGTSDALLGDMMLDALHLSRAIGFLEGARRDGERLA